MSDASRNGNLRFVLIGSDELARVSIKRHLAENGSRVAGETDDLKSGLRLVRSLQPNIVVLELLPDAEPTLEAVRKIHEEMPSTGIILLSPDVSPQLILAGIRSGAHEFLTLPLDITEVDRAVNRIRDIMAHVQSGGRRRGRLVAIYPAKGGVGGSSVATNLALALTLQPETKVALADFNLQIGDLALMLDIDPEHSFARAVEDGTIDEAKLESLLARHRSGVRLLTVCDHPEESDLVLRNHVPELFGLLTQMFDWVIADLGRHIDERSIELLDLADDVVLVTAQNVPTIRNTRRYLDLFERLEIHRDRVRLIVNRFESTTKISLRDLENTIGRDVFWSLPNEYRPMRAAIDSGNPILLDSPRSRLSKSYRDLGRALSELPVAHREQAECVPNATASR
jgi:pilus assembly protein CpaE